MSFPYITEAFDTEIVNELKKRSEKKIQELNRFTPFIWMSSGALVCTGKIDEDIEANQKNAKYKGCIISNHLDPKLKYTLKESVLGYDLDGNLIKVEGEKGLKISSPIIESMEIDTDGENNTIKIARINITIFSLKQLEMFELFFLKSGMTVVMEYGHNHPRLKNEIAAESFINKKNWESYVKECAEYFYPDAEKYKTTREEYFKKIKRTNFNYDFWIAKVRNFNISYESADNVYKVELEISSGNELNLWMPFNQNAARKNDQNPGTQVTLPATKDGAETWMKQLCSQLVMSERNIIAFISKAEKEYAKDFFNWGVTSGNTNTENASKESYISFKLILDIMNSMDIVKLQKEGIISTSVFKDGKDYCIPVNSHPSIISTNSNYILPGSLPSIVVNKKRFVDLDINTKIDYKINEKSFNYDKIPDITLELTGQKFKLDGMAVGNLLNVFVKTSHFVSLFKNTYTYADLFTSMLADLNTLLFGIPRLEMGQADSLLKNSMTIIDKKISQPKIPEKNKEIYRFKIDPITSIVHDISFNLELSNLMQAQAMYETQMILLKNKNEQNKVQDPTDPKQSPSGNTFDAGKAIIKNISQPNSDNLFSIDWVNYKVLVEASKQPYNQSTTPKDGVANVTSEDTEAEAEKKLNSVISGKSIKFKALKDGNPPVTLIYTDTNFIQAFITTQKKETSALTYLECDITIDGISGIKCGQLFRTDGVPETYNKNGAFQIQNIKQSLQADTGWRTTLNAAFRCNID